MFRIVVVADLNRLRIIHTVTWFIVIHVDVPYFRVINTMFLG